MMQVLSTYAIKNLQQNLYISLHFLYHDFTTLVLLSTVVIWTFFSCVKIPPITVPVQVVLSSTNVQVNSGSTLFLTAFGYGTPLPVVSWLRGGQNLTNSSRVKIFESVITKRGIRFARSVLEICDVDYSASGEYLISASNGITADLARLEISVRGKHFCSDRI